jgi:hypothetical protein
LLDGGYLQIVPSAKKSSINIKIGSVTAGKKYILRYSVRGSTNSNMVINTLLRRGISPYENLTLPQSRKLTTSKSNNEILLIPTASTSSASVIFQVDQQNKYYLDNVKLYEASASITNPDDSIKFVYNATKASKTISLNGSYVDTKGTTFNDRITLSPYASAVLIKDNDLLNKPNGAPSVSITAPWSGKTYDAPGFVNISAEATDPDDSITKVEFYIDSTLVHTETVAPYEYHWNNVQPGEYIITAKATDSSGHTTTSTGVLITVTPVTLARGIGSASEKTISNEGALSSVTTLDSASLAITSIALSNQATVTAPTEINQAGDINLSIGPNPARNYLNVFVNGRENKKITISLFSISGALIKTVQRTASNQIVQLDLSSLTGGVYIVRATYGTTIVSKQFVKQ